MVAAINMVEATPPIEIMPCFAISTMRDQKGGE